MTESAETLFARKRETWWRSLTPFDRAYLIRCAEENVCPPAAAELLMPHHGTPHGPEAVRLAFGDEDLDDQPVRYYLGESWRDFLLLQAHEKETP